MTYRELVPHPALAPWVDRFWVSRAGGVPGAKPRVILPDGCIDVMVHVDAARGARAQVVGTMTRAIVVAPGAVGCTVAVRFRPGGATAFLRTPAERLTDRVAAVEALPLPWLDAAAFEALAADATDAPLDAAARRLEASLLRRVGARELAPPDARVAHAVARLFAPAPPPILALGDELGVTRQHLGRVFREHVGVAPKQLARVARLQRTAWLLQRPRAPGLAEAALVLGYFDQAHMTRELRELAGVTPAELRRAPGSILPIPSLLGVP